MAVTIDGTSGINTPGVVNTAAETIATTLAVTGVTTFAAGTAALPAITTTGDTNTGIFFPAADTIAFAEGGVEAMRITSDSEVVIGSTTSFNSGKLCVINDINHHGIVSKDAVGNALYRGVNSGGTVVFNVADTGNVTNTNNSYGAISDLKLKENIADATPKLDSLMQVKVRNYNLKSDPTHKQLGVIAQELEQVFPAMVEELPDKDEECNELGTTTKSVKYSVFVPMLIKAIQEQQALITALTTRITALEGVA